MLLGFDTHLAETDAARGRKQRRRKLVRRSAACPSLACYYSLSRPRLSHCSVWVEPGLPQHPRSRRPPCPCDASTFCDRVVTETWILFSLVCRVPVKRRHPDWIRLSFQSNFLSFYSMFAIICTRGAAGCQSRLCGLIHTPQCLSYHSSPECAIEASRGVQSCWVSCWLNFRSFWGTALTRFCFCFCFCSFSSIR